ncbi:GGDEF domain-containing protein [Dechloromonas sp. HYN0024]|uniref:GGDEF domain-containing protein n=1 Tax=Dechloromonas sp. HYN0024 TaxID=2231055 RepID=UPI000E44D842|nr:GGDEF domain-containing protein [Dechloromonas sp. HYN0024]AXS79408.1 GGDEF domain-containing protein [Dechloromonas sp. HYN0024]
MLELISHVVQISARRDRTEINSAMVDTLLDLFHPQSLTIYRCYSGNKKAMVFACAGYGPNGQFLRNAYLPDHRFCQPIERDPLLNRCRKELSAVIDFLDDGMHRIVFPVIRLNEPIYLIELLLSDEFSADHRVTLMGLIEYFGNHISLLDYGEADTLTGLASRKTFDKHLFELLGKAASDEMLSGPESRRRGAPCSSHWLAVCDIDHFKNVNDSFGHLIGDEVLIMLSQEMRRSFRFDDQLFRFGGEEFIALLQPTDETFALATLERFRSNVENQLFSRVGRITVSIGFSMLKPHDTPTDVIDRADEALYYAKRHGRNRVDCYEKLIASGDIAAKEIAKGEIELF